MIKYLREFSRRWRLPRRRRRGFNRAGAAGGGFNRGAAAGGGSWAGVAGGNRGNFNAANANRGNINTGTVNVNRNVNVSGGGCYGGGYYGPGWGGVAARVAAGAVVGAPLPPPARLTTIRSQHIHTLPAVTQITRTAGFEFAEWLPATKPLPFDG